MGPIRLRQNFRKYVTKTICLESFKDFTESLSRFHEEKENYFGVSLFQFYMKYIFGVFLSKHKEKSEVSDEEVDFFPLQGNLDTGDAHGEPFPPFMNSLFKNLTDSVEISRYYGPAVKDRLKAAVTSFLLGNQVLKNGPKSQPDYVIGSGTVHLYDLICMELIKRKGDTIIIPTPTYGFFIPQVYRAGGRPLFFETDKKGMIHPSKLDATIFEYNQEQVKHWKEQIDAHVSIFVHELSNIWNIAVAKPSSEQMKQLKSDLDKENDLRRIEKIVDNFLFCAVLGSDQSNIEYIRKHEEIQMPLPPKIVGALFINPTVYGAVLDESEIRSIANVFQKHGVVAIEDLAYLFIDVRPHPHQGFFMNSECSYISLLGVSKLFSLAGLRLGLAVSDTKLANRIQGRVENAIGFISPVYQEALIDLFSTPQSVIKDYLNKNNSSPSDGYKFKRKLSIFLIEGTDTNRLTNAEKGDCKVRIVNEVLAFFNEYEKRGIYLFDEELVNSKINIDLTYDHFKQHLLHEFIREGLSSYFDLVRDVEAGFFFILDCQKMIDRKHIGPLKVSCSFDAFALLSYFFGLKLFPSEAMGVTDVVKQNQLRYSFSCGIPLMISLIFTAYIGLKQLENIDP